MIKRLICWPSICSVDLTFDQLTLLLRKQKTNSNLNWARSWHNFSHSLFLLSYQLSFFSSWRKDLFIPKMRRKTQHRRIWKTLILQVITRLLWWGLLDTSAQGDTNHLVILFQLYYFFFSAGAPNLGHWSKISVTTSELPSSFPQFAQDQGML